MSSKRKSRGVPGNAAEEQRMFDQLLQATGRSWLDLVGAIDALLDDGIVVKRLSLKGDWRVPDDMLVIMTADGPDGPIVCFHRASSTQSAWSGLAGRLRDGGIEWREDKYAG